jgi:hypothetical protein
MVTRWGMSNRIGTVFFGMEREVFLGRDMGMGAQREFSERTASIIDEEVQRIIANRYDYVATVLSHNRPALDRIAELLLERETLEENDLLEIVAGLAPVDSGPWDEALFPSDEAGTAATIAAGGTNGHATRPVTELAPHALDAESAAPSTVDEAPRLTGQLAPGASGA